MPPRRKERHVREARNVRAFESLFDSDFTVDDVQPVVGREQQAHGRKRAQGGNGKRHHARADVVIRDAAETATARKQGGSSSADCPAGATSSAAPTSSGGTSTCQRREQLHRLAAACGNATDDQILHDVLLQCNGDVEKAIGFLAPGEQATASGSISAPEALEATQPASSDWDLLPLDVQMDVLQRVCNEGGLRDVARLCCVSRDAWAAVRKLRIRMARLTLPEGVRPASVGSLIAAHPWAVLVDISKWRDGEFSGCIRHQQLLQVLQAVGMGESAASRRVGVEELRLKGLQWFAEPDVLWLVNVLRHLRRLRLEFCSSVDDKAARVLSQYRREPFPQPSGGGCATGAPATSPQLHQAPGSLAVVHAVPSAEHAAEGHEAGAGTEPRLEQEAGQSAPEALHGLESLTLSHCQVTNMGVGYLLGNGGCRSLLSLELQRCPVKRLSVPATALMLQRLCLTNCHRMVEATLLLPDRAALAFASFSDSTMLRRLTVSAPRLQELRLGRCVSLTQLSLCSPKLDTLLTSTCRQLDQVERLECANLRRLNMRGCGRMHTSSLIHILSRCRQLESLDVGSCILISQLPLADLDRLTALRADGCRALTSLSVNSRQLQSLVASGCRSLQQPLSQMDPMRFALLDSNTAQRKPVAACRRDRPGARCWLATQASLFCHPLQLRHVELLNCHRLASVTLDFGSAPPSDAAAPHPHSWCVVGLDGCSQATVTYLEGVFHRHGIELAHMKKT